MIKMDPSHAINSANRSKICVAIVSAIAVQSQVAFASLDGSLSGSNSTIASFIQGDFANLAIYLGLAASAFSMIVRRGQGFGWMLIIFAVGIVLKNINWVMSTITDLAGGLR